MNGGDLDLDLDGASKQKQQWCLLSRLLKLTHAPFGRASPGVKSIWLILQNEAPPPRLCDIIPCTTAFPTWFSSLVGQKDKEQGRDGRGSRVSVFAVSRWKKKKRTGFFFSCSWQSLFQMHFLKYQSIIELSWSCLFPFSAFGTCEQWLLRLAGERGPAGWHQPPMAAAAECLFKAQHGRRWKASARC